MGPYFIHPPIDPGNGTYRTLHIGIHDDGGASRRVFAGAIGGYIGPGSEVSSFDLEELVRLANLGYAWEQSTAAMIRHT